MNKTTNTESDLPGLFQALEPDQEPPAQLREEVKATLRHHKTLAQLARLFTVDMARTAMRIGEGFFLK